MTIKPILGLAALSLLAAPAAAHAVPGIDRERFRVEIEGVQTTAWSYDVPSVGRCNPGGSGNGTEVVRFRTLRPQVVTATRIGPTFVRFGASDEIGFGTGLDGRAAVTRRATIVDDPFDPTCRGTGGEDIIPRDCGSRREQLNFTLGYEAVGPRRGVTLRNHVVPMPTRPFRNCPVNGVSFPTLLDAGSGGRPVVAVWPAREVFDRDFGKTIVIGRGAKTDTSAGRARKTTIRWTVSLRRLPRR